MYPNKNLDLSSSEEDFKYSLVDSEDEQNNETTLYIDETNNKSDSNQIETETNKKGN